MKESLLTVVGTVSSIVVPAAHGLRLGWQGMARRRTKRQRREERDDLVAAEVFRLKETVREGLAQAATAGTRWWCTNRQASCPAACPLLECVARPSS